jgi:hypothetical protein
MKIMARPGIEEVDVGNHIDVDYLVVDVNEAWHVFTAG